MKLRISFLSGLLVCLSLQIYAQSTDGVPVFQKKASPWADSLLKALTIDEKIGQLFMVAAYSNRDAAHERELLQLISQYNIGGVIFFQGGPLRQAHMYNRLQSASRIPLWTGIDGEWGLSMRLDSTIRFPYQMTLGAIENDSLIYAMGAEIARQAKRVGVHVNFAPVVDINNNPANPVINFRSFGENKERVTRKSLAYMQGMQDHGILANAKHFPGHGDTDTDSHLALPVIKHSVERLKNVELYPYKPLFDRGLASVMVAHLSIPALDSTPNLASTLSPKVVNGLLKKEMGFKGLVFTDALNMKGVANYYKPGEVDLMALKAGNDVLLFAEDVPKAMKAIRDAIAAGTYSEQELDKSVKKILMAKAYLGLNRKTLLDTDGIHADLNNPQALHLKKKLSEAAITLVQNRDGIIPLKKLDQRTIAVVTLGGNGTVFKNRLSKYTQFTALESSSAPSPAEAKTLREQMLKHRTIIVNVEGTNNRPGKNFGLTTEAIALIESVAAEREVILVHMGNPYALAKLKKPELLAAILVGYQDESYLSRAAAEALMGAIPISGKLPVSVGAYFPAQTGIRITDISRLYYSNPLELGLPFTAFDRIDSIVIDGLKKRAYPGCQVLVAKSGKVIYHKSFGFHTYEDVVPVRNTDIYDIASITKIAASTVSLMKLQDLGKFDLDQSIGYYMPEIPDGNPYKPLVMRKVMAHVAGLPAWVPFYTKTLKNGEPKPSVYTAVQSDEFPLKVAHDLYIRKDVSDSIMTKILATPLRKDDSYKYSDIGYYFVKEIVGRQSGTTLDRFAYEQIYKPLGLNTMGYFPLDKFPKDRIVPTEYDTYFRKQLIHGDVHDPGAAMLGGAGGHAGLFSNAEDLAVLMQMLINGGTYGGQRILKEETVEEYTRCQYCENELDDNRRGAGFDKPFLQDGPGPTCKCVTFDSFGHSGFTGTITWADPVEDIVYVFLSNRVYPTAENNRLAKMDIRTRIQSEIYRVLRPEGLAESKVKL